MSSTPSTTPTSPTPTSPASARRPRLAAIAVLVIAALLIMAGQASPASAHIGHLTTTDDLTSPTELTSSTGDLTTAGPTRTATLASLIQPVDIEGLSLTGRRGDRNGEVDAECFVDFDDDLVLQYTIPGAAEDTFMNAPWYQACNDGHYYPAVAVEPMEYGHFHLGYEDDRVGPCGGDMTDWGRHSTPRPSDDGALAGWIFEDCVEDIDPVTEPRSGISPHWTGHRARIFAYEGHTDTEYLPFQMKTLQVVDTTPGQGDPALVEVCHLPPGPILAIGIGGGGAASPWQCTIVGEGYWNMSGIVDSAIEVRVEFLDTGIMIDNIGIDLI